MQRYAWLTGEVLSLLANKELVTPTNQILQLDVRIRLCIRDSLFRLAQNVMQRHYASRTSNTNKSSWDENKVAEENNNHNRFVNSMMSHLYLFQKIMNSPKVLLKLNSSWLPKVCTINGWMLTYWGIIVFWAKMKNIDKKKGVQLKFRFFFFLGWWIEDHALFLLYDNFLILTL